MTRIENYVVFAINLLDKVSPNDTINQTNQILGMKLKIDVKFEDQKNTFAF